MGPARLDRIRRPGDDPHVVLWPRGTALWNRCPSTPCWLRPAGPWTWQGRGRRLSADKTMHCVNTACSRRLGRSRAHLQSRCHDARVCGRVSPAELLDLSLPSLGAPALTELLTSFCLPHTTFCCYSAGLLLLPSSGRLVCGRLSVSLHLFPVSFLRCFYEPSSRPDIRRAFLFVIIFMD